MSAALEQHCLSKVFQNENMESTVITTYTQHMGFTNQVCRFGDDVSKSSILLAYSQQLDDFAQVLLLLFSCSKEEADISDFMLEKVLFENEEQCVKITVSSSPNVRFSMAKIMQGKVTTSVNCYSVEDITSLAHDMCSLFFYGLTLDPYQVRKIEKFLISLSDQCLSMDDWFSKVTDYKTLDYEKMEFLRANCHNELCDDGGFEYFLRFLQIHNDSISVFVKLLFISDFLFPEVKADDFFVPRIVIDFYIKSITKKRDPIPNQKDNQKSGSFQVSPSGSSSGSIQVAVPHFTSNGTDQGITLAHAAVQTEFTDRPEGIITYRDKSQNSDARENLPILPCLETSKGQSEKIRGTPLDPEFPIFENESEILKRRRTTN